MFDRDFWSFLESWKFYAISGVGSIIGGTAAFMVYHERRTRLPLCTAISLYTMGGVYFTEAIFRMRHEWRKEEELEAFREQPSPAFMPELKKYLELEMNQENIPYKMVEEAAIRILKNVSEKMERQINNSDVFCQSYKEYLEEKIASLENISERGEQPEKKKGTSVNIRMMEALCRSSEIHYGRQLAKNRETSDETPDNKAEVLTKFVQIVTTNEDGPGTSQVTDGEDMRVPEIHTEETSREEEPVNPDECVTTAPPATNGHELPEAFVTSQPNLNGHQDSEYNGVKEECSGAADFKSVDSSRTASTVGNIPVD